MTSRQLVRAARVANATTRRLAGGRGDRGGRRPDRVGRTRRRAADATSPTTHEVHDLGDVSLLPGFVETHIHMHYPAAPDYREIARPEPVERSLIRATAAMRDLLLSGATTARDTGSRADVALAIRSATPRRHHPRAAPAGRRGADHDHRRALLVPGRRGRHDRRRHRAASARRRRPGSTRSRSWRRAAATRRPPTRARSSTTPRRLAAATAEAHRLGLPVLAHSLTAVSNARAAEAGIDTIIHGGVWWTDYPVRDRAYAYDPAVADRIAARGHLGRPDDRRGRAPRGARRGRRTGAAGLRPLGAAGRAERAGAAARVHARHGRAWRPVHRRDGHGHADRHVRLGRLQRPGLRAPPGLRPVAGHPDDHVRRGGGAGPGRR